MILKLKSSIKGTKQNQICVSSEILLTNPLRSIHESDQSQKNICMKNNKLENYKYQINVFCHHILENGYSGWFVLF